MTNIYFASSFCGTAIRQKVELDVATHGQTQLLQGLHPDETRQTLSRDVNRPAELQLPQVVPEFAFQQPHRQGRVDDADVNDSILRDCSRVALIRMA